MSATKIAHVVAVAIAGGLVSSPARGADAGFCEVNISGGETVSVRYPVTAPPDGHNGASSGYWMSAAGQKAVEKMLNGASGQNGSGGLGPLLFNCGGPDGMISIEPALQTRDADVPFGPKKYVLADASDAKPGQFRVLLSKVKGVRYGVDKPGTLNITRFDSAGVAGTFSYSAAQRKGPPVTITGTFTFPCKGDACKK